MIDEDEWPDVTTLRDYNPIFPPDPNFYHPDDLVMELAAFLRDHTVKQRRERVANKRRQNQERETAKMQSMFG